LTLDFIKPLRPGLTSRQLAWVGRGAILLFMLLSASVAPLIGSFQGLFHYLQTALAYLVPPVAALLTLMGGHGLSILLFTLTQVGLLELHFTLVAGLIFVASLLILLLAGSRGRAFDPAPGSVWQPAMVRPETHTSWWKDYRVLSVALLLLTAIIVLVFH